MAALPETGLEEQHFPEPLAFFTQDFIHPENTAIIEEEQQRWRLLGFVERLKLRRYVASLARELQAGHYNRNIRKLLKLQKTFVAARAAYRAATFISPDAKETERAKLTAMRAEGWRLRREIDPLRETFASWKHYQGWIDYETEHRKDLRREAKREQKIRKDMRTEAKWLQSIIRDVWRKNAGCHYTYTPKDGGKERTKVPQIERSIIQPDCHWFFVKASVNLLFIHKWVLPNDVSIDNLMDEAILKNLRAATKRQVDAIFSETNQLIIRVSRVDSPDALPRMVKWRDTMMYFPKEDTAKMPYCIGVVDNRKFKWFDFASNPHVLIAGRSQSGKSNLVNGMIASLLTTHTPAEVRVVLVDMKGGIEFTHWHEVPHLLWEVAKEVDEARLHMERMVAIMRRRMSLLSATKAKDIAAYNARVEPARQLARIFFVIDELNNFVGLKGQTEEIHNLIMLLTSQGRAVGVHVIAATQHPEVAVIPGRIKTNMSVRLCGSMPSVSGSMIVLDSPAASYLPNIAGRFVASVGRDELKVQAPYIPDNDISDIVSSLRRLYPDVSNELSDMENVPAIKTWDDQRVLKASIEWFEGQISADKLHKMLGDESPGERHLRKLCRQIQDDYKRLGSLVFVENGTKWKIERVGKAYYLRSLTGESGDADTTTALPVPPVLSVSPSVVEKKRRFNNGSYIRIARRLAARPSGVPSTPTP